MKEAPFYAATWIGNPGRSISVPNAIRYGGDFFFRLTALQSSPRRRRLHEQYYLTNLEEEMKKEASLKSPIIASIILFVIAFLFLPLRTSGICEENNLKLNDF
ncbi:hypothetical protein A2V82_11650 [candidate division KSB1 bacterium RBG_16_48_16]|nr:MAG: hypothetical protein A2V82_11650 [candidate division KSB1 bacterium RBG_16_48_16]